MTETLPHPAPPEWYNDNRKNRENNPWTVERIAQLRTLWETGDSCALIAKKMGDGLTRNAIIGKAARLGLPQRVTMSSMRPKPSGKWPKRVRVPQAIRPRMPSKPSMRPVMAMPKPIPKPVLVEPVSGEITILNVTGCKYATGQNKKHEHVFCNAPLAVDRDPKSSYCEFHAGVVVRKVGF